MVWIKSSRSIQIYELYAYGDASVRCNAGCPSEITGAKIWPQVQRCSDTRSAAHLHGACPTALAPVRLWEKHQIDIEVERARCEGNVAPFEIALLRLVAQ